MMSGSDGMAQAPTRGLTPVRVAQIGDTIAERWRTMAAKLDRPQSHACVMTLIICVEEEGDNRFALDIIDQLSGKYPIRVISVGRSDKERDTVRAWVNTACEGEGSAAICSEEIVLQAGPDSDDRLVSAVRGLLVSDLPVMLWWRGGAPLGSALWNGLQPLCDRVIVDSHRFVVAGTEAGANVVGDWKVARGDGASALEVLRELVKAGGQRASVRDLNWERTSPWRGAIATCFDDREMLSLLSDIDRCSITFAATSDAEPPSARALLMAGWLSTRLPRLREHSMIAPGTAWANLSSGRIVAITLCASASKTSLLLVRQSSPTGIEVQAHDRNGKAFRRWHFGAATLTEAQLLDGCLQTLGRDPLFESSLGS